MPPEPPNTPAQLRSKFHAVVVIVTVVTLGWSFFVWVLPEEVVKTVYWFVDALFSVVVLYSVAYWWRWRAIPPFFRRSIRVFPPQHKLDRHG
jgi:hypothetical protein